MSAASANTRSVGQASRPCQVLLPPPQSTGELRSGGSCRTHYDAGVSLNVWGFAAVAVPLVATPGASTAVVLRNSLAGGVRSGIATAVGANTGSICYGLLTAFGVAVALQRWPLAP